MTPENETLEAAVARLAKRAQSVDADLLAPQLALADYLARGLTKDTGSTRSTGYTERVHEYRLLLNDIVTFILEWEKAAIPMQASEHLRQTLLGEDD